MRDTPHRTIAELEDRLRCANEVIKSSSPSYTLAELAKLAERWAIEDKILATDRWLVSSLIAWLAKKERKGNERGIQI